MKNHLFKDTRTGQIVKSFSILEIEFMEEVKSKCPECPGVRGDRWLPSPYKCQCGITYEAVIGGD